MGGIYVRQQTHIHRNLFSCEVTVTTQRIETFYRTTERFVFVLHFIDVQIQNVRIYFGVFIYEIRRFRIFADEGDFTIRRRTAPNRVQLYAAFIGQNPIEALAACRVVSPSAEIIDRGFRQVRAFAKIRFCNKLVYVCSKLCDSRACVKRFRAVARQLNRFRFICKIQMQRYVYVF